jgi:hypothetical protein
MKSQRQFRSYSLKNLKENFFLLLLSDLTYLYNMVGDNLEILKKIPKQQNTKLTNL